MDKPISLTEKKFDKIKDSCDNLTQLEKSKFKINEKEIFNPLEDEASKKIDLSLKKGYENIKTAEFEKAASDVVSFLKNNPNLFDTE